jgi:hypothetical protein
MDLEEIEKLLDGRSLEEVIVEGIVNQLSRQDKEVICRVLEKQFSSSAE